MKKILLFLPVAILAVTLYGCKSSDLSSSKIVRLVNKELQSHFVAEDVVKINVGTYECNDAEERLNLRKLAAANLVTYQVERYAWWEKYYKKVTRSYKERVYGYYWWNYEDVTRYRTTNTLEYDFCDHYVVTVALKGKGKKLVTEIPVREIPIGGEEDEDMVENLPDSSSYAWNTADLTEEWPYMENPFLEKEEPKAEDEAAEKENGDVGDPAQDEDDDDTGNTGGNKVTRIDSTRFDAYSKLSPESEEVGLKAVCIKAFKARNIQKYTASDGTLHAKCEVLFKTYNTTDAGRILGGYEDGVKTLRTVSLTYYEDKGWVISEMD